MVRYSRLRRQAEYRLATENEIAVDNLVFGHAQRKPEDVGYIPRPALWLTRFSKHGDVTRIVSTVLRLLWQLTCGAPFHALSTARFLFQKYRTSDTVTVLDSELVGLALSGRALDVICEPQVRPPSSWIIPPWIQAGQAPPNQQYVPLLALVSYREILGAFAAAVGATASIGAHSDLRKWILQTYTAVPWMLTRAVLTRVDANYIIAAHFDRWAVLADLATRTSKRRKQAHRALRLVQHGYIGGLGQDGTRRSKLRYKLATVQDLYAYNDESAAIFAEDIFTPRCSKNLRVHLFRPNITLTEMPLTSEPKVLFVGHPLCAELQVDVFRELSKVGIIAYYKPHPVAGTASICERQNWNIVKDRQVFPRVDVLVSYRSTLVTEYEVIGIPAVIHPLTQEASDPEAIANEVLQLLSVVPKRQLTGATPAPVPGMAPKDSARD